MIEYGPYRKEAMNTLLTVLGWLGWLVIATFVLGILRCLWILLAQNVTDQSDQRASGPPTLHED